MAESRIADPTSGSPLAQARRGDAQAQAALYREFGPVVHGIALAHVGPEEADDVTQDTFMTAFAKLDTVRDDRAFPGWLGALARNTARDALRRRSRQERERRGGDDAVVARAASPVRTDEGLADRVLALLRSLPETYRESLTMRLVEGLTGPEIAARTGMTKGSVRVNLCRGMALLRPLLEKEGWP